MKNATFSVFFWNIWLDNQIYGREDSEKLLTELSRLLGLYKPDFIGLSEVLQDSNAKSPFVLDYIKNECGYTFDYFAPASCFTRSGKDWLIGNGFCAKVQPKMIKTIAISNDSPGQQRGYSGYKRNAIAAQISFGEKESNIIVAHPLLLRLYTLRDHYQGTKTLEDLIRSSDFSKNTVLVGDFNEPDFMPRAFKNNVKDSMNMRTGSRWDTTWRHNASTRTIIRTNLDQLYWSKDSNFGLDTFTVIETNASDHRPILASFTYN